MSTNEPNETVVTINDIYKGTKVLPQDQAQRDEGERYEKNKAVTKYNKEQKEKFESDLAKYEKELALYEKDKAEAEKKYEKELKEFKDKFYKDYGISYDFYLKDQEEDKKIADHYKGLIDKIDWFTDEELAQAWKDTPKFRWVKVVKGSGGGFPQGDGTDIITWVPKPLGKEELKDKYNKLVKQQNVQNKLAEQESRKLSNLSELYQSNLPQWVKTYASREWNPIYFPNRSALTIAMEHYESKTHKNASQAMSELKNAQSQAIKMSTNYLTNKATYSNQINEISIKKGNLKVPDPLKTTSPSFQQRIENISPKTVSAFTGLTKATKREPGVGFKFDVTKPALLIPTMTEKQNPLSNLTDSRIIVTTPDGKQRIFKNKETADKFIARVGGNYQIKAAQSDMSLVSPYLKNNGSYIGFIGDNPIQGPGKPKWSVELNGKVRTFNSLESAQKFIDRTAKNEPFVGAIGNIEHTFAKDKPILMSYESNDILQNLGAGMHNSLYYSTAVDLGEAPKPKGLEYLNYYASKGLTPITNIPKALSGQPISPTLTEKAFETGIQLALTGKTEQHDPIGDYIKKDPIGTLVQLPTEAALWVSGAKAGNMALSGFKKYSPLIYQSEKIVTKEGKTITFAKSVTWKDKPVVSIQKAKIVKGLDVEKIPYEKINVGTREGFEAALGSGIEKSVYYSPKALASQVDKNIIPKIAAERANLWVKALDQAKGISSKAGSIGERPIQGLTKKQAEHIFGKIAKEQKAGDIDLVHGSVATKGSIPEPIQKLAGSALQLGDVDVVPKGANLVDKADNLIRGFAKDFPLEKGQTVHVRNIGKESANRQLVLVEQGKPEKKILEVVLRTNEDQSKYGISQGTKILGQRIPFKKFVTLKDYPIKTHTADYQLLTNTKQAIAYQKGRDTLFDIYPSSGRTKDIVRGYWNLKGKAFFKGGIKGRELDKTAEQIRSKYPNIEFTDYTPEKVLLYSSQTSKGSSNLSKGVFEKPIKEIIPKESIKEKNFKEDSITSIKPQSSTLPKPSSSISKLQSSLLRNYSNYSNYSSRFVSKPSRSITNSITNSSRNLPTPLRRIGSSRIRKDPPSNKKPSIYNIPKIPPSKIPKIPPSKTPKIPPQKPSPFKGPSIGETPSLKPTIVTPPPKPPSTPSKNPFSKIPYTTNTKSILIEKNKRFAGIPIKWKTDKSEGKPIPRKYRDDFLGNTRTDSVLGIFGKRKETTYNKKTISKALAFEKKNRKSNSLF